MRFMHEHQVGQEALRLCSAEDDQYASRLALGSSRERIENDAEQFFAEMIPTTKPQWFNEDDYEQMILIRDQWI